MDYNKDPFFQNPKALSGVTDIVYEHLEEKEGASGDTTGAADTGLIGVTDMARKTMNRTKAMGDKLTAKLYLGFLEDRFNKDVPGYSDAPIEVKEALLDTAYNAGESVFTWGGMKGSMAAGDWEGALLQTLDTANIGGKTSRGLAKRRAQAYNLGSTNKIAEIEQKSDGTLIYKGEDGSTIFHYKKPRHPDSGVGTIPVGY